MAPPDGFTPNALAVHERASRRRRTDAFQWQGSQDIRDRRTRRRQRMLGILGVEALQRQPFK
jgi:hypothetical protein